MSDQFLVKTILILSANPKGTAQLRLDQEMRDIEEGLKRAQKRDQFVLNQKLAVRPRDVQRAMLDLKPQIVHFSGHGAGEEGLSFEDEVGKVKPVNSAALAGLFKLFADKVECVVLNACYSEVQAEAIAQYIPYVIGMSQAIGDRAALEFAVSFYDALGAGESIEFAYELGCNAIQMAGIPENLTPVLKVRPSEGESATPQTAAPPVPSAMPGPAPSAQAIEVFFSYAHEDKDLRDKLAKHLKILERQQVITAWHDRRISGGKEWAGQIDSHLNTAGIILLLVSSDFLASDYCYDIELQRAMQRHEAGEARVIPVILREVDWHGASFGKLQALPNDARPVTSWTNEDQAFTEIAKGIRTVVEELTKDPR